MIVGIGRLKLKKGLAFSAVLLAVACLFETGQPVAAASEQLSTKVIDGKKNYGIYSSLKQVKVKTGKGKKKKTKLVWKFGKKLATTKEFKRPMSSPDPTNSPGAGGITTSMLMGGESAMSASGLLSEARCLWSRVSAWSTTSWIPTAS